MWNDNDTNVDLIDFEYLVQGVCTIIDDKELIPSTIGVFGDWGSGKSSLLRMIESRYEVADEVLIVKFNGWLFEGYDDAKTALMNSIVESVVSQKSLSSEAVEFAKNLFKQIDWLKLAKYGVAHGAAFLATGGIGNAFIELQRLSSSDKSNSTKDFAKGFEEGNYDDLITKIKESSKGKTMQMGIREFHQDLTKLLDEANVKKLIVFIDDLDRCTPDTIIATLEAIKLFLYVENSVFVISADERLIKYAVRKRFPEIPGDASEVGRDYLEKLIQFPVRLPSLSESEIETYINLLFTKLRMQDLEFEELRLKILEKKGENLFSTIINSDTIKELIETEKLPDYLEEDLILSAQITPILAPGIKGNPRQCKRFLNTMLMRFQMAKSKGIELKRRVLAKIMLLEYFKPETFRTISGLQNLQNGKPKEIAIIEKMLTIGIDEKGKEKSKLNEEFESWLSDSWLNRWFKTEPMLASEDLRTYYFFTRDNLSSISLERSRMSNEAQETFRRLVSESQATIKIGLKSFKLLSETDAATIFSSMTSSIREEEDTVKRASKIKTLCLCTKERASVASELVDFMRNFPENQLAMGVVPQVIDALKKTSLETSLSSLLVKWKGSENSRLAKAAEQKLK